MRGGQVKSSADHQYFEVAGKFGLAMTAGRQWEHFEHSADIGIRGIGETCAQAFENAAIALTAALVDPASVDPSECVSMACSAPDMELLFYEWLNDVIYQMATRKMLFSKFEVSIHGHKLTALACGQQIDRRIHHPAAEPKGATLTALSVTRQPGGQWIAQCVVDV